MSRRKAQLDRVTTWMERFSQALSVLCAGREPPVELCEKWINHVEDNQETLQDWVAEHGSTSLSWAQSIVIIDAAQLLADEPEEGRRHLDKNGVAMGVSFNGG